MQLFLSLSSLTACDLVFEETFWVIEVSAADVNAAVLHAMGLLLAFAAHIFGSHSDHRKHPLRSGPDGIILHATSTPHAKTGVFWATMQVTICLPACSM